MQLLLVLFFFPLLPRFFFLSFLFFSPVQIRKLYISERGRIFIGLDFISFSYRVNFRTRAFLRRKEIDMQEDFFRRKSRPYQIFLLEVRLRSLNFS